MAADQTPHYAEPGRVTRRLFNPAVMALTRLGISIWGSRVLEVRGRSSGQPRQVPVNLLTFEGRKYLVSARGESQWVRNVRAAGGQVDLLVGHRREHHVATELTTAEKIPVLRAYLRRWKMEVGTFFEGVDADSPDEEIERIAPRHPVFLLDGG